MSKLSMSTYSRRVAACLLSVALAIAFVPFASQNQVAEAKGAPTITVTKVSTGKLTLKPGQTYRMGAKATSAANLVYASSKKGVATVSPSGTVKGKKAGTTVVTVTTDDQTVAKHVKVSVVKKTHYKYVASVKLTVPSKLLSVGATETLKARVNPKSASNQNLIYSSSDESILTVSQTGELTALKAGQAKVTVTSAESAAKHRSATITVTDPYQNFVYMVGNCGQGFGAYILGYVGTSSDVVIPASIPTATDPAQVRSADLSYEAGDAVALTSLDTSQATSLKVLDCSGNQLTALGLGTNVVLKKLDCSNNQLAALDVSANLALKKLDCSYNQLATLDISKNVELAYLDCTYNKITDTSALEAWLLVEGHSGAVTPQQTIV